MNTNTHRKTSIIIAITFLVGLILIGARTVWHESPERAPGEPEQVTESIDQKAIASAYFSEHLTELSPTPAVLGGTFFVTHLSFPKDGEAVIEYEDGHIALMAKATYTMEGKEVRVTSFQLFTDTFTQNGVLIKDNPGFPEGVWYLSFDSPGAPAQAVALSFETPILCTIAEDGTPCPAPILTQGLRVRILGNTAGETVTVRRMEVVGE